MPSNRRLILPVHHWRAMLDHVLACLPEEACGLLAGREEKVEQVWPIENVAHSSTRFRMQPQGQIEALLTMEAQGLDLVGIYHSHPHGPTQPSPADLAEMAYPEAATLIWCCDGREWRVQGFEFREGQAVSVELVIAHGE